MIRMVKHSLLFMSESGLVVELVTLNSRDLRLRSSCVLSSDPSCKLQRGQTGSAERSEAVERNLAAVLHNRFSAAV